MKKFFIFIGAIVLSILFTACGSDGVSSDDVETVSEVGILSAQLNNDEYLGTHLLHREDGDILSLRSLSINLSDSNYLENKVELLGFLDSDDDVFQVTGVRVVEVLSKEKINTELTDYKNTEFGFEWRYYSDWEVESNASSIIFVSPDGDRVTVSQNKFDYQPSIADNGSSDTPLSSYFSDTGIENLDYRKVGVDQMDAVRVESEGGVLNYHLYRSGLIYVLGFVPASDNVKVSENIFYEMLSEFKFTGFTVDSGDNDNTDLIDEEEVVNAPESNFELTEFESLPYSFGGSYPNDWYYAGVSGVSGVLHHYGFSDESVTDDNEILSLDVIPVSQVPNGQKMVVSGRDLVVVQSGADFNIYVVVDDHGFRLSGNTEYRDLLINMALDVKSIETE